MENLDSDLLRTFVAVAEAGSVTDGAARIYRSQSATSLQIKRLEATLGQPVFERHGRGVVLSDTGRRLLPVAQEVTARLDAVLRDISQNAVTGKLCVGIPDDHGRAKLSEIVAAFTRHHPKVELEVTCALSADFPKALEKGLLDLAIYEVARPSSHEEMLFEDPTCWVSSAHRNFPADESLPVALFDHACWWRDAAITSLKARGKPYRIVYSSQSVSGVIAAVEAGIAVGLLGRSSLHSGLSMVSETLGFESTPASKLVMASSRPRQAGPLDAMKAAIRAAFLVSVSESSRSSRCKIR
ncbi:LysR substrate-binding domain-containing protein [Aquicoccus porphyridii]|uniref:LysR family transcriptional regulator n=1 Tax=Aquicoccus porphyridii TaxID=1852029 RepID=A0A5A9YX88_9RHOB|nr:LysR substrate-binding domain-containing protein [Aquicoccus porphyridii]KAA0909466.1 LysR family transcriptional regulator [Aquicoccus porphyridii]RAI51782.1 transcriptional regulator [Rhodobacteraceae bacterium AsT-22]